MSETEKKPTTRRTLMGHAGIAALAGIAAVAIAKPAAQAAEPIATSHDPDAPLLALCARFLELQAAIDVTYDREEEAHRLMKQQGSSNKQLLALEERGDIERAPLDSEQKTLLADISELAAATLAGQRARARVLMSSYGLHRGRGYRCAIEWCDLAPLFRDLLGEDA